MSVQDKNETVTCPFNSAHVISRSRLMVHISKCKKNLPPNHDFVQCSYNALHYVKKHKLAEHYEECSYRQTSIASMATWNVEPSPYLPPRITADKNIQESTESWEDVSGPSFNSEERQTRAPYMITPAGMSKANRKEFREAERRRLREMDSSDSSLPSRSPAKQMKIKEIVEEDVELRKPVTPPNMMPGPRIAARLPITSDSREASTSSFHSDNLHANFSGGRGRGIMSWKNVGQPGEPQRRYSPDDYPDLS